MARKTRPQTTEVPPSSEPQETLYCNALRGVERALRTHGMSRSTQGTICLVRGYYNKWQEKFGPPVALNGIVTFLTKLERKCEDAEGQQVCREVADIIREHLRADFLQRSVPDILASVDQESFKE